MAIARQDGGGLWGLAVQPEATTRIAVTVTFLRQAAPQPDLSVSWPDNTTLNRVCNPSVGLYRHLYNTVGAPYVWWLRRTMPDAQLAALLAAPGFALHVLTQGDTPAGFYELDAGVGETVNLSYFGLMPQAIGRGLGTALLRAACASAWAYKPRLLTVNTCTADHPRALPNYLAAGFSPVRSVREMWDVPDRLGLFLPAHLRV